MTGDVVIVPPVPALLARYASLQDPVAELRSACLRAVSWIVRSRPRELAVLADFGDPPGARRGVAESLGMRVVRSFTEELGFSGTLVETREIGENPDSAIPLVVVANGSARRGDKAPGHLDDRSFGFDETIERALAVGDPGALRTLDTGLGEELLAAGIPSLVALGKAVGTVGTAEMLYAADPFGVRYWVITWAVDRCG